MKRLCPFLIILSLGPSACSQGPKGLGRPAFEATEKAAAAMQRANEYRDAGTLLYEPRFLDLEKAVDELKASATKPQEKAVAEIAVACAGDLRNYRENLDLLVQVSRQAPSPGRSKLTKDANALHKRLAANIDSCISEVRSHLQ